MPITLQSIREPLPAGAIRAQLQPDGTVVVYMPGDELPVVPGPSLADIKVGRINEINAECRSRILSAWPLEKQVSATLGIYGQSELDAMTAFIDAHIDASNTACDDVDSALNQSAVEAVTVAWPV